MSLATKLSLRSVLRPLRTLKTTARFQSTETTSDSLSKKESVIYSPVVLGLPIVRTGNDKLQVFHQFLANNAPKLGLTKEMVVYQGDVDEIQFRIGNVSLSDESTGRRGKAALPEIAAALESLVTRVRLLRNGATGPISVPFGTLAPRYRKPENFNADKISSIMLNPNFGATFALLEGIIAVARLDLLNLGIVKPTIVNGKTYSPPRGTPNTVIISTALPDALPSPCINLQALYTLPGIEEFLVNKDAKKPEDLVKDGNWLNGVEVDLGTVDVPGFRVYSGKKGEKKTILHEASF